MAKVIFVLLIIGALLAAFIPLIQLASKPTVRDDLRIGAAPSAGLANSFWPTVYRDSKRTARSTVTGPSNPSYAWIVEVPHRWGLGSKRGATIGLNGRDIYVAGGFAGIVSFNKDTGSINWRRFAEEGVGNFPPNPTNPIVGCLNTNDPSKYEKWIDTPPTIGADGTLYVTTEYGWLLALDPENGSYKPQNGDPGLKYKLHTCKTEQAPVIGPDGTLYFGSWDGYFYAYKTGDGFASNPSDPKDQSASRLKWKYQFYDRPGFNYTYGTPAIGDDGTVYFAWRGVWAFRPEENLPSETSRLKWFCDVPDNLFSVNPAYGPTIGPDGTLYITHENFLDAIDPAKNGASGCHKWRKSTGGNVRGRHPAVGTDGTVYFGSDDGYLYAIRPDGSEKWKFALGTNANCDPFSNTLVDASGTVYINTNCGPAGTGRLYAIGDATTQGIKRWELDSGRPMYFHHDQFLAMDSDGSLYNMAGGDYIGRIVQNGATLTPTPIPQPLRTGYLSDQNWISATTGDPIIPVLKDKANNGDFEGGPISIANTIYQKGLGTHATSEITYNMNGSCSEFHAIVGVDDSAGSNGSVTFEVYADSTLLHSSEILTGNSSAYSIDITQNMLEKQRIRLVVTNAGDNWNFDRADWANARVVCGDITPGDLNGDKQVTIADYNILLSQFGKDGSGDFNKNGKIDIFDYTIPIQYFR